MLIKAKDTTGPTPGMSASLLDRDHSRAQKGMRIPAGDIEALVLDRLRVFFSSRIDVSETLAPLDFAVRAGCGPAQGPQTFRAMACDAARRAKKPCPGNSRSDHRRGRSDRNPTEPGKDRRGAAGGERGQRPDLDPVVLSIEAKVRRAGKGKRLVIENGVEAEVNAGLVELIKEAFAIRNQLLSGSHDSIEALSGRLGMNKGRLISLVRLSYLGPEFVRALLAGSQSNALTPSRLLRLSKDLPHDWKEQRGFLGFAA